MRKKLKKPTFGLLYSFARQMASVLMYTLYRVKVVNIGLIQKIQTPYIIISNHRSAMDPIALSCCVKDRCIRFMAKKELMSTRFTKWLLGKKLRAISVDRHSNDIDALRSAIKAIKEGHVVGIFPEGTRHKKGLMDDMESGVAILALRCQVPLVPVYIHPQLRLFRRTQLIAAPPVETSDLTQKPLSKTVCDELLMRVTRVYEKLYAENAK